MIAIWGANGFIGRHLANQLVGSGKAVKLLARDFTGFPFEIPNHYVTKCIDFFNIQDSVASLEDCKTVVLLVTASQANTFANNPEKEVELNVLPYKGLFEALVKTKNIALERVVFLSSGGTVYGRSLQKAICEEQPTNPISPYGRAKLTIEKELINSAASANWDFTILRPSNPVGVWIKRNSLVNAAINSIKTGEPLPVFGGGLAVRDYFDVRDLARAIVMSISNPAGKNQIFNVGSGVGLSINQVLELVRDVTGQTVPTVQVPSRSLDVDYSVLDCSRINKKLGWQSTDSLKNAIQQMWEDLNRSTD